MSKSVTALKTDMFEENTQIKVSQIGVIFVVKLKTQGCLCSCQVARGDCLKSWLSFLWAVMLFACRRYSCLPKNSSLQEDSQRRSSFLLCKTAIAQYSINPKCSKHCAEIWVLDFAVTFMSPLWSQLCESALRRSLPRLVMQFLL